MKISRKYKLFVQIGWLLIAVLAIGIVLSLITGNFILAGLQFSLSLICLYLGGRYSSKLYLQTHLIDIIQNNGGQIEYEQIESYFSDRKYIQEFKNILPELLKTMVEENLVTNQGGIITLKNENI
ncbi:MAG: hypothetical protein Q3M24_08675 [Candidatus Electrothrix aestuarii]|uniref:Uncharacterized protein n=1 Tax=Candidatus Electrothrix aestuarii TaxID=3062594 RepID=A0AAU8LZX0_9BACT|nr:hypothetical protein [Candidatus Electrothrix aestuarii]